MKPWELFEIQCCNYLTNRFQAYHSKFIRQGGTNSTKSDIAVIKNGSINFYIESKMGDSQSGQFVVLPDSNDKKFIFSNRNKSEPNEWTDIIIDYLNSDFKKFIEAGTTGEDIMIDQSLFADWIIDHYKQKNVKYVITYDDDYIIFPLERYMKYFKINARIRKKGSGSKEPARKNYYDIIDYLNKFVHPTSIYQENNHFYFTTTKLIDETKVVINNQRYQFTHKYDCIYEVRQLSNTKNPTVIFDILIQQQQDDDDLKNFINDL